MTKSKGAQADSHLEHVEREEEDEKAIGWCEAEGKGPKACIKKDPQWRNISLSGLKRRISSKVVPVKSNSTKTMLNSLEESELVSWISACGMRRSGKYRDEIALEVKEILKVRHKQIKRGGRLFQPLSPCATRILTGGSVSKEWFLGFFVRHADRTKLFVPQQMDTKRAASNTEKAVKEHFEGQYD